MDEYDATYLLLRTVGQWCVGISTDVYLGRTVGSPWNVRCRHSEGSHSRGGDIPQEWTSTYHVYLLMESRRVRVPKYRTTHAALLLCSACSSSVVVLLAFHNTTSAPEY